MNGEILDDANQCAISFEPFLGISIVNYYSHQSVELLVNSLKTFAEDFPTFVSIVDNSQDPNENEIGGLYRLAETVSSKSFHVKVTKSPSNLGYGSGNNLAVTDLIKQNVSLIWILNPDTKVRGVATDLLKEVQTRSSGIWATSTLEDGKYGHGLGTLNTVTGKGSTSLKSEFGKRFFSFEYPAGHSILFTRESWLKLGGFDERYFLFMEEADLALRAHKLDIRMDTLSSVSVEHDQGLTTGSNRDTAKKSTTAFREATKSRVTFFRQFYPLRLPLFLVIRVAYAALVRVRGNRAGSHAVLDGISSGLSLRDLK